jgi:SAM-dependent methyltransferase
MIAKNLLRPLPGVKRMSRLRQRLSFDSSAHYWEQSYAHGGTSGSGSYGSLAHAKAELLNAFVHEHDIRSVAEFGCGDGNQLALADYPCYVGLDVSKTAIGLCKRRFADDLTKSFFVYDGDCFVDRNGLFAADLALSLDVVYHLIEDSVFATYMTNLFAVGQLYVIVYSTNADMGRTAPHVRHRQFTSWVEVNCPEWRLAQLTRGPNPDVGRADFFVFERVATSTLMAEPGPLPY